MARCSAITRKGEQCRGLVQTGSEFCAAHDPSRADARRRAASIAGRSKPGSEISEVKRHLRKLADDCRQERITPGIASVCAQVLGVWLKAADTEIREREAVVKERELTEIRIPEYRELEGRMQELESLLEAQKARGYAG